MKRIAIFLLLAIGCSATSLHAQSFADKLRQLAGMSQPSEQTVVKKSYPSADELLGAWTYRAPSIEYKGNDLLASIAVNGLKSEIAAAYVKGGLKPGKGSVIFKRRGKVHISMGGQELDGNYTYSSKTGTLHLTLEREGTRAIFVGYVTLAENKVLTLQFDANEAIKAARHASTELAKNSNLNNVSQLLANYPGIMLGGEFSK
ncbi:DUF4923 family protein [uncultured Alistipes sp.]|uniref:lipocalin-like domain-containing protein n=1 Tax=uncultured Alistipes sp. TaxID=538949 RepID=UPI002620D1FA|nr:DUF4923 family protein [uncultured Alistipes sp.]